MGRNRPLVTALLLVVTALALVDVLDVGAVCGVCKETRVLKRHCRDGNPGCDLDGTCDGMCTMAVCRESFEPHPIRCAPCVKLCRGGPTFYYEDYRRVGRTLRDRMQGGYYPAISYIRVRCDQGATGCRKRLPCTLSVSGQATETVTCPRYIDYGDRDGNIALNFTEWGHVWLSRSTPGTYRLGPDGINDFRLGIPLDVGEATTSGTFYPFLPNPYLNLRGDIEVTFSAIEASDSIFHEAHGTLTGTALKTADDAPVTFEVNF
jgi:hypothetical protein